jgi:hypothetical protein
VERQLLVGELLVRQLVEQQLLVRQLLELELVVERRLARSVLGLRPMGVRQRLPEQLGLADVTAARPRMPREPAADSR